MEYYAVIIPIYFLMIIVFPVLHSGYKARHKNYKLGKLNDYISQKELDNRFFNE